MIPRFRAWDVEFKELVRVDALVLDEFESKKYNEKEALGELFEDNSYPFKIIGNIYENPELVEVSS